jgi:hypothetical protein
LKAEKIARGEMSPADLVLKKPPAPSQPALDITDGSSQRHRLAKRPADTCPAPVRQPQPNLADVLAAIDAFASSSRS